MKKVRALGSLAFLTATLLLFVTAASAAPIAITNASFENPSGPFPNSCGAGCTYSAGAISGWTSSGVSGQLQPGAGQFTSVPDGSIVAWSNGGTISQTVGTISAGGILYTLTGAIGLRSDLAGSSLGTLQLLVGSTPINGTGAAPTPGNFSTFTATYTTTAADIGKSISIQFSAPGIQGNFDNVHLDATGGISAIPEPATLGLFLLGFGGLAIGRRLRRT